MKLPKESGDLTPEEKMYDVSPFIDFEYIREQVLNNLDEIVKIGIQTGFGGKITRNIEIMRRDVFNAASNGANMYVLSCMFGIDRKTCEKHFKKEILYAHGMAKWRLQNKVFIEALTSSNPAERVLLAKSWLGMSETGMTEEMATEEGVEFKVKRPEKKVPVKEEPVAETD